MPDPIESGLTPESLFALQAAMEAKGIPVSAAATPRAKPKTKPIVQNQSDIDRREKYLRDLAAATARAKNGEVGPIRPQPKGVPPIDNRRIPQWINDKVEAVKESKEWPIYLCGNVGVGKTCVAADLYSRWPGSAKWMRFSQFCDRTAQLQRDGEATFYEEDRCFEYTRESWWDSIGRTGLYVIDDVGVGMPGDIDRTEALWNLLEARTRKPVILTSNLHPDKLFEHYDQRVVSRIFAGTRLFLHGKDQRAIGHESRVAEMSMEVELPDIDWGSP